MVRPISSRPAPPRPRSRPRRLQVVDAAVQLVRPARLQVRRAGTTRRSRRRPRQEERHVQVQRLLLEQRVGGHDVRPRPGIDVGQAERERQEEHGQVGQRARARLQQAPDHQPPQAAREVVDQRDRQAADGDARPEDEAEAATSGRTAPRSEPAERAQEQAQRRRRPGRPAGRGPRRAALAGPSSCWLPGTGARRRGRAQLAALLRRHVLQRRVLAELQGPHVGHDRPAVARPGSGPRSLGMAPKPLVITSKK